MKFGVIDTERCERETREMRWQREAEEMSRESGVRGEMSGVVVR